MMKQFTSVWFGIYILFVIGTVINIKVVLCQGNSCPFHLCTPARLECLSNRLKIDQNGCRLCRCEETALKPRPCALHGCTVDLLQCQSSTLKRNKDGCTLCECDDMRLPVPNPDREVDIQISSSVMGDPNTETYHSQQIHLNSSMSCPDVSCTAEELGCSSLKRDEQTRCKICDCENNATSLILNDLEVLDINNLGIGSCPDPHEMLNNANLTQEENRLNNNYATPKFKLVLRKLKKGFIPRKKYKIILLAVDRNYPFKEFLIEFKTTSNLNIRPNGKKATIAPQRTCGAGYIQETESGDEVRIIPNCRTAAVANDSQINKTQSDVVWIAPPCGCVKIRAFVVDFTGRKVYFYEGFTSTYEGDARSSTAIIPQVSRARINMPLHKNVCEKSSISRKKKFKKRGKKNKGTHKRVKPSKTRIDCCKAATVPKSKKNRSAIECEKAAALYSIKKYFRNNEMKKTCRKIFKACCVKRKRINNPRTSQSRRSTRKYKGIAL